MTQNVLERTKAFLELLGLDEAPMVVYFTDTEPSEGFSPKPMDMPNREKEAAGEVDWGAIFGNHSCVIGHIWRARRKRTLAWFSKERFGCMGAAFWLGYLKPQIEAIIHYVSSGIPGQVEGELYCQSPDELRRIFEEIDPEPVPAKYLVFCPLEKLPSGEKPELVCFFTRPEPLCGLHQLATFVTDDAEVVASPWSAACGGLIIWPRRYQAKGQTKAVLSGWDPSARKFFKTDELSFTVTWEMYLQMLDQYQGSFLGTGVWQTTKKKAIRSSKAWGEGKD